MFDVIGDVHGHADELEDLLQLLGYAKKSGVYRHATRTAIFLGDWIDRGPQIRQTLEVVRSMVQGKSALAVIGNHELNAMAWATLRVAPKVSDDSSNQAVGHATEHAARNTTGNVAGHLSGNAPLVHNTYAQKN